MTRLLLDTNVALWLLVGARDAVPARVQDELQAEENDVALSAVIAEHVEHLPWHHRDPFDRLFVAQAVVEERTLVTADRRLAAYGVPVLW